MALRHSVSFLRGTMVTYVTWDVPLREIDTLGNEMTMPPDLQIPASVWKAQLWQENRRARSGSQIQVVEPEESYCIGTPARKALEAAIP